MKNFQGLILLLIATGIFGQRLSLCGQEQQGMIKYTPEFRFTDGLYLNFFAVKNNRPVPKSRIVTSLDYKSDDFFKKLMVNNTISYYDTSGTKQEVKRGDLWGFADKGIIYVQLMGGFSPFSFTGKICHIFTEINLTDTIYYDPASGYYPDSYGKYGYPFQYYDPYYNRYISNYTRRPDYTRAEPEPVMQLNQYLMDFETGEIWDYNVQGVKELIKKDPELFSEYNKLRNTIKKKLMFSYIRKYNERNPLYFRSALSN